MGQTDAQVEVISVRSMDLRPNPWNPNVMTDEIFRKEIASIREFGFIDPLTVRASGDGYEIIDGEHRWKAGQELGMTRFPCIVLDVDDATAMELTVVLNETRGRADREKLAVLVRDLAQRRDEAQIQRVLPFSAADLKTMLTGTAQIDWDALREKRDKLKQDRGRWVEKVYRMPAEAAEVIDRAVERIKDKDGVEFDWQALELIAADSLAS
jgi:ParB-like chromosome segregation protein Spo0J